MTDIYKLKFEKLILEYGKLVTHLKTLKRSYVDSQANIANLTDQLKQKEKILRRNEIEIESLDFRNKQLTKRISILQIDLNNMEGSIARKCQDSCNFSNKSINNDVVQEELQKRIAENSNLACQLENNIVEVQQLKESLENLEKNSFEKEMKYKCDISRLKHQNQKLSVTLQKLDKNKFKNQFEDELLAHRELCTDEDFPTDFFLSSEEQQLQNMLNKFEQENQLFKMELDVLKMENESLQIANKNLTETSGSCQRRDSFEEEPKKYPIWHNEKGFYSCDVGKLSVPFKMDDEIVQREQNLVEYFRKLMKKIIAEKRNCETLISLYAAEYEALTLRSNWPDMESKNSSLQF